LKNGLKGHFKSSIVMPNNLPKAVGLKGNVQYTGLLFKKGRDEVLRLRSVLSQDF
jgi:hypothetical protein